MNEGKRLINIFNNFSHWLFTTSAYILLPLFIYILIALSIKGISINLFPDIMFITIILYGDILNKIIMFNKNIEDSGTVIPVLDGFVKETNLSIGVGILLISASSLLLAFSIVDEYNGLGLSNSFNFIGWLIFGIAIFFSAVYEIIVFRYPMCLYNWDGIPGKDNMRLIVSLIKNFGIEWVTTAKIEKIDNGKTIKVFTEQNFLLLKLNDEQTEVYLEIDYGRTDKLIAKKENHKLNIYLG